MRAFTQPSGLLLPISFLPQLKLLRLCLSSFLGSQSEDLGNALETWIQPQSVCCPGILGQCMIHAPDLGITYWAVQDPLHRSLV